MDNDALIPSYVTNHGIVKGAEVDALLRESKVGDRVMLLEFFQVPEKPQTFSLLLRLSSERPEESVRRVQPASYH